MQQIYDKINAHKYLNNDDIAHFISFYSNGKVKVKFLKDVKGEVYYDTISNCIVVDKYYRNKDLKFLVSFSKEKLELERDKHNSTFLVDLYNLYLLQTLFHELHHAEQITKINKGLTFKTKLVKESYNFLMINPKLYTKNHDLYYHEYDATIMALIRTLDVIEKNYKGLNKNSIIEFNRIISAIIYHSYGNSYSNGNESKIYDKFKSPIAYSKFLSRLIHTEYENKILLLCIQNLKEQSKTEYMKLINGFKLSEETMRLLYDIWAEEYSTLNILNEVKQIGKIKVKVK